VPNDVEEVVPDEGWGDAIRESYDKVEAAEAAPAVTPAAAEPAAPATEGPARDEKGRFAKDAGAASNGTPPARTTGSGAQESVATGAQAGPPPGQAAPVTPPAPVLKAPQSWKAELREKWGTLPPDLQTEVLRREREIQTALQESAEKTKGAGEWTEVVRPYEAQIRQLGVQPAQYVGDLLKTAHALTYSHPAQKADVLAGIIMQFGVPPADLDQALVARMQGRPAQQAPQQQFRDPRIDQLLQEREAEKSAAAEQRVESFVKDHEYFEDVADDMLDILKGWEVQKKDYQSQDAMEKAYRMACNGNESVATALQQKKAAASVANAQASTQKARAASSSVKSTPGSALPAQPGDGWEEHLRASMEKLGI
jgi:hypothetical protein